MDEFAKATSKVIQSNIPDPSIVNRAPIVDDLMVSYFHLNPNNTNHKTIEKINEIGQWVRARSKDDMDVLATLRDIKYRLGSPKLGLSDVDHLHNYITLRKQAERLEMRAKAMEA